MFVSDCVFVLCIQPIVDGFQQSLVQKNPTHGQRQVIQTKNIRDYLITIIGLTTFNLISRKWVLERTLGRLDNKNLCF